MFRSSRNQRQSPKRQKTVSGNSEGLLDPTFVVSFGAGTQGSADQHPNKPLLEDLLHSLKILLGTTHREGQQETELNNKLVDEEHQSVG